MERLARPVHSNSKVRWASPSRVLPANSLGEIWVRQVAALASSKVVIPKQPFGMLEKQKLVSCASVESYDLSFLCCMRLFEDRRR